MQYAISLYWPKTSSSNRRRSLMTCKNKFCRLPKGNTSCYGVTGMNGTWEIHTVRKHSVWTGMLPSLSARGLSASLLVQTPNKRHVDTVLQKRWARNRLSVMRHNRSNVSHAGCRCSAIGLDRVNFLQCFTLYVRVCVWLSCVQSTEAKPLLSCVSWFIHTTSGCVGVCTRCC